MSDVLKEEIIEHLDRLSEEEQRRMLEFARALSASTPKGTPGRELTRFAGAIPPEDLRVMARAIEEECERIDPNEW